MGELPPLLLLLSLAARGLASEESHFQQELPPEVHFCCLGRPWPVPLKGCQSLSKTYQAEENKIVLDAKIVCNQSIPLSGPRSPFGTAPGEYQFCPPQCRLHNLKQGGVAFLCHLCAHPSLRGQLTFLSQTCLRCILTLHSGLGQPWALAACGATLQMAKVELANTVAWLKKHTTQETRSKLWALRRYRRLMKCPAVCAVGRAVRPADRMQVLQKLFCHLDTSRRRRELLASDRQGGTEQLPHPHGSSDQNLAVAYHDRDRATVLPSAPPNLWAKRKGVLEAAEAKGNSQRSAMPLPLHPRLGTRPLATAAQSAGGATQKQGCPCPDGDHHQVPGQQLKAAKVQEAGGHGHTPRTEEAAWAASALTFLLVTLTLAVLYTRLHRNCRRGQSLYWTMSGEDGRETVATVIKRRILSAQSRRKKRPRQQRVLLQTTSSESSE